MSLSLPLILKLNSGIILTILFGANHAALIWLWKSVHTLCFGFNVTWGCVEIQISLWKEMLTHQCYNSKYKKEAADQRIWIEVISVCLVDNTRAFCKWMDQVTINLQYSITCSVNFFISYSRKCCSTSINYYRKFNSL